MSMFGRKLNTQDQDIWITSDLHFWHKSILNFCSATRPYETLEDMHEGLIADWNSKVKPNDYIFSLGDFSFKGKEATEQILSRLNGKKVMIMGNHCKVFRNGIKRGEFNIVDIVDYLELRVDGVKICMGHFPITCWNQQGRESLMFYGHCVDGDTEVLTTEGFKFITDLKLGEEVATVDKKTKNVVYQKPNSFIVKDYTGYVYEFENRSVSYRVTEDHIIPYKKFEDDDSVFIEDTAKGFYEGNSSSRVIFCQGFNEKPDYPISDAMLMLCVSIVTDGSLENSNLVRFHLKKQRKIDNLEMLLKGLQIPYSKNLQKSGTTKINFAKPQCLKGLSMKPLDNFVRHLSKRQIDILLYQYSITDGCKTSKNSVQISTSKKCEADLIQEVLVTSGYRCNKLVRERKTGSESYVLSVNNRVGSVLSSKALRSYVDGEKFYCLSVANENFICRRKGKVHVTGNCHGSFQGEGKTVDVGWDNWGEIINIKQAIEFCQAREIYCPDHNKIIEE